MIRVVVGCLFAPLIAPAVFLLCSLPFEPVDFDAAAESFGMFWALGGATTLLMILFLGLPTYLAFSNLGTATFFSAGLIGIIAGAILWVALSATLLGFHWQTLPILAVTGVLTGCAFYLPVATLVRRSRLALSLGAGLVVSWGVIGWTAAGGFVHPDFSIAVGNGYQLVRANAHETYIANTERVVVPGKVVQYAVIGDLVVGNVTRPDRPDSEVLGLYPDVVVGHFLLDTQSGSRELGLTLPGLRSALEARGIKDMPALREPKRP